MGLKEIEMKMGRLLANHLLVNKAERRNLEAQGKAIPSRKYSQGPLGLPVQLLSGPVASGKRGVLHSSALQSQGLGSSQELPSCGGQGHILISTYLG